MLPLLIPAVMAGISALGGALSNTKAARTTTSSGSITPTLAPEYKTLSDMLRARAESRLNSSMDMGGYAANGVSNINDAFSGIKMASDNNLTSRGLGTSPVAGAVDANFQNARGGNIAEFLNTIPQLQREFQNQDMGNALNVLNLGRGTTSTGTSIGPGSAIGSGMGSAAGMLALMKGMGAF